MKAAIPPGIQRRYHTFRQEENFEREETAALDDEPVAPVMLESGGFRSQTF